jgi:hypothetical protein
MKDEGRMKNDERRKREKTNHSSSASSSTPPRFEEDAIGRTERPQPLPSPKNASVGLGSISRVCYINIQFSIYPVQGIYRL